MARKYTTLGMVCLISASVAASDRPDLTGADSTPSIDHATGVDLDIANESATTNWRTREPLFGDMGGFRSMLDRHGMAFEISSLDEGFGNPDGGLDATEDSRYAGLTDVVFSIDTEGAGWWADGLFFIDLQNTRGGDISDVVGDLQGISNIVAPPGTSFVEYFLDQSFADGRLRLKIGKQDANADFVVSDGGGEFINSSFGIIPTVPLPTFPAPSMGIMGGWSPSEAIHLKAGYWDGSPEVGSGISTAVIDGSKGTVGAVGIEITPFGGEIIDGTYRIGFWRHSEVDISHAAKSSDAPVTGPAEGLYFTADQGIWENGDRRLSFFAQGGWGEADRSAVSRYFGGGMTFNSPFKGRPNDVAGIGVAYADVGRLERGHEPTTAETIVELFYKVPVLGWMTLNPDIQWVHRPGGTEGTAFVAGLRVATVF